MSRLEGLLVAISISDAPDRSRLGFPRREIDRAVHSLCTALVREGADIAYSGNLDPDGYTFKIFRHLAGAYASGRDTPFRHFVPEPVGRTIRYEDLYAVLNEARGTTLTELARGDRFHRARARQDGILIDDDLLIRSDVQLAEWYSAVPRSEDSDAFSLARRAVTDLSDARVVLGGKMGILDLPHDKYQGNAPGIAEEAIMALEARQPMIPLGAFGGAARDVAIALDLLSGDARVPRGGQHPTFDSAMARTRELRDRIPDGLRERLSRAASDDRSEQLAFAVAALIADWLALSERGAAQ
ncbi:MAG: hypothetical protein KKD64_11390 [Alphaproteobacteria bacterium]|nr:hypothetical protein [Alphaproteobacteria bacterium]MBU0794053.1 hypothetical protein [Alphaproteobacteria bacterium]MBU0877378.1 hypothetical protein [Alphaproteobacteria bacterium]MBU1770245.1 hypothetical protein [Alphaproteobacteria bacterium]